MIIRDNKITFLASVTGLGILMASSAGAVTCDVYYAGKEAHYSDCSFKQLDAREFVYSRANGGKLIGDFTKLRFIADGSSVQSGNSDTNNSTGATGDESSFGMSFSVSGMTTDGASYDLGAAKRGTAKECIGGNDLLVCSDANASGTAIRDSKTIKKLGVYLSNFTEVYLYDFSGALLSTEEEVNFAIRHDYINNHSRIVPNKPSQACPRGDEGMVMYPASYALKNIESYFGKIYHNPSELKADNYYCFDGKNFHFGAADGESGYWANVVHATETSDGEVLLSGWLSNPDNDEYRGGTFFAGVRRSAGHGGRHNLLIEYIRQYVPQAGDEED